jgi:ribokinase
MKIMTIGGATYDIFMHIHDLSKNIILEKLDQFNRYTEGLFFEEGTKLEVDSIATFTGGGATNTAVSFHKLGFDVSSCFSYGDDQEGAALMTTLSRYSIDTSLAVKQSAAQTGISYIIPLPSGDRTIFAFRGANNFLTFNAIKSAVLKKYKAVYISSLSGKSAEFLPQLAHQAHHQGLLVANNPGISQLRCGAAALCKALQFIDILILNYHEAEQFMVSLNGAANQTQSANFDILTFFSYILSQGPSIIALTHGAHGVYVATPTAVYYHPSLPAKITNTLGAGDAFGSTFVATLLQERSVHKAMLHGILNSRSVISFLDAKTGLLTKQELEQKVLGMHHDLTQEFFQWKPSKSTVRKNSEWFM